MNILQMDQDLWMKALYFHGPLLLQTVLGKVPELVGEVKSEKLSMCKFIKSKLHLLFKQCDSKAKQPTDHSVPIVPIEVFRDALPVERRDLFFKSLDRGNILTLRVINDSLPDDYKLLVLCKHECCMKLDDLSLIMYLPKLQEELNLAGGKLESSDLIRAAVCSCDIDTRKLNVTLDSNILDDENVELGKISEKDLPPYIGDVDFGSSYVEYLHQSSYLKNPNWSEQLYSVLNFEKNHLYSFFEGLEGKKYRTDEYGTELKEKQNMILSNGQCAKAQMCYESGNFTNAFIFLNKAIQLHPLNVEALVLRGTLYSNTNNLKKAFQDVEKALKLAPKHEGACKQMSILLVAAARLHMEKKDFVQAQESLDAALHLDNNNQDAIVAVDEIRQQKAAGSTSENPTENLDKTIKMLEKRIRIGSSSSESSSSKRDDSKEKQETFLEVSTRAFLTSMEKDHTRKEKDHSHKEKDHSHKEKDHSHKEKDHSHKKSHHHSHPKAPSKSPKKCITID